MHITEFSINDISINDDIVIKTSFYDNDMKDLIIRSAVKDHVTNLIYQQKYDVKAVEEAKQLLIRQQREKQQEL